ncbi:MAG: UDP-N-acetylmuramoyl-L-alanyl-D-glutamate--2,6-diaminopimelate ligase [Thermoleophilaceae bacterium]
MTLRDLMGNGAPEVEVTGLAYSSRSVSAGALFFCVPGFTSDGHDFAPDAVQRGAAALVCQRPLGLGVPEVVVGDVRAAMGPAAARFYGHPTSKLDVCGITGTNGKTTTAFLVRDVLEQAGRQTGLMGTVKQVVGGAQETAERTTREAIDLQATFVRMLEGGDRACAMEVSSHALALGRAEGIDFAVKVFTNLTQDHLDFHDDMEAYYLAKRRLFDRPGPAVVNTDDVYGRRLAEELGQDATTYGLKDGDYRARDIGFDVTGAEFTVDTPDGPIAMTTRLPGLFNVSNALAAFAAARLMGVQAASAAEALSKAGRVPGRFEPVEEGQPFGVLVDYAHTPDSLENVLRAARELCRGELHVVFGAGGDRDSAKRPLMGRAAADNADRLVVTSDNPRSEDPDSIVDQVMAGAGARAQREVDRRRAIDLGVHSAQEGDVVVIAGKGHEQGQEFEGGRKEPFDDVQVAREALRART